MTDLFYLFIYFLHPHLLVFPLVSGKHAENVFGELFNEANTFYSRANSLQDRMDRLAIKVTQLDSSIEEGMRGQEWVSLTFMPHLNVCLILKRKPLSSCFTVSLQDINMRKAFKSSTVQDQQVLSKGSTPNAVAEMYNSSDRPPPLSTLTAYR